MIHKFLSHWTSRQKIELSITRKVNNYFNDGKIYPPLQIIKQGILIKEKFVLILISFAKIMH